jgi:2-methylcitrate dehydratase PrpD
MSESVQEASPEFQPASPAIAVQLAGWIDELRYESLPEEVISQAKEAFRDAISNLVFGKHQVRTRPYETTVSSVGGRAAGADGQRIHETEASLAFTNAAYVQSSELDDCFVGAGGHPGSVVVPVVLALSERKPIDGRAAITAAVAGYEIMHRATAPIEPYYLKRGFQATGLGGPFGAAAAAAKVLGFPRDVTAQTLAVSGTYCCGLCEYDQSGGEVKRLYSALAARAGVEAADLAAAGVTGPLTIFEGRRGLFLSFSDFSRPELATANLGAEFRIMNRWTKRYPTVAMVHGALDGLRVLCGDKRYGESDIARIQIEVPETAVQHGGGVKVPVDMVSAQFSFAYSVALRLLLGSNDLDLYEDPALRSNPEVTKLCEKVDVVAVPDETQLSKGGAIVTVEFADGEVRSHVQYSPAGTPSNPLGADVLYARFDELTRDALPEGTRRELNEAISDLDHLSSLDRIKELIGFSPS